MAKEKDIYPDHIIYTFLEKTRDAWAGDEKAQGEAYGSPNT